VINVWRGVVDVDTAESAVGVTTVRLEGKSSAGVGLAA
jgi:hypothetical protein